MTMKLVSSPSRNSSITTSRPASPNWPANMASAVAIASLLEDATTTPLPAASPLAFTTSGVRWPRSQAGSKLSRVKVAERAVGMPCRWRNSLAKAFEPSSLAAARRGPKQRKPASAKASTMPATSGASGPTMVRSTRSARASCRRARISSAATPTLRTRGSLAVPALPGATSTSATRAAAAHFQASACSRPPPPTIRIFIFLGTPALVTEVAHAGKDHRHVVLVGCGDHFGIALAATRMDDGADAKVRGNIQIIAKGQECIGRHYRALERNVLIARLHGGETCGIDAAHLSGAHANCRTSAREYDRVRFDEAAHAPREAQVGELSGRRLASRRHRERFLRRIAAIARLHEQPAGNAAELQLAAGGGAEIPEHQHAHTRLAGEDARGILVQRRHRQHLDELTLGDDGGGGCLELAIEGDDAAERRGRIGTVGGLVGGEETRVNGGPAGVGMLDDDARRRLELAHGFDG